MMTTSERFACIHSGLCRFSKNEDGDCYGDDFDIPCPYFVPNIPMTPTPQSHCDHDFEDVVKRALTQTIIMADSKPGCYDYEGAP